MQVDIMIVRGNEDGLKEQCLSIYRTVFFSRVRNITQDALSKLLSYYSSLLFSFSSECF